MGRAVILVFLISIPAVFLNEGAHRGGLKAAISWIKKRPADFFANVVLTAALICLPAAVAGSFAAACLAVLLLYVVLTDVSFFKLAARNEPLYAADFLLMFSVMGVAGASNFVFGRHMLAPVLYAAAVFLFGRGVFENLELGIVSRVITGVAAVCVITALSCRGGDDFSYGRAGFLRGFLQNFALYFRKPKKPEKDIPRVAAPETGRNKDWIRPNVIVVLSESFFDITRIDGLELSADPVPGFKLLKKEGVSGTLLVTPFGGGTCNVEAEFLTGCTVRHFNLSKSFYYSYMKKPVQSLAVLFKGQGYQTAALHTFNKAFYNRETAFAHMGFDKFLGLEDLDNPRRDGFYVSDGELTAMIKREFETKTEPAFIFAISMENHQPYTAGKYGKADIKVMNAGPGAKTVDEAEAYIRGLSHADAELVRLAEFVKAQKEPTVLLFFGDHLGAVGPSLDFYRKIGYIDNGDVLNTGDIARLYSPDFLMISNYKSETGVFDYLGANFLANMLLDYIGIPEKPELFYHLDLLSERVRCLSRPDIFADAHGGIADMPEGGAGRLEEAYRAAQYRMFL